MKAARVVCVSAALALTFPATHAAEPAPPSTPPTPPLMPAAGPAPVALAADIPAQALAQALENLAHQTGLQLVWLDGVVTNQQTRGAPAGLPATEALARLLEGTGLRFESLNTRVARIVPANPPPGADAAPPLLYQDFGGVQLTQHVDHGRLLLVPESSLFAHLTDDTAAVDAALHALTQPPSHAH